MPRHSSANSVRVVEVGPRDGLQNISNIVPTSIKLALISRLQKTGLQTIEITSVVSPRAIPQLSDNHEVLGNADIQALIRLSNLRLPVLIPNLKGFEVARNYGVKEIAVFVSASESFSKANINCTIQQGLDRARVVAEAAGKHDILVRGYISCIFSCPFGGSTPPSAVLNCVRQLRDMGCYEISLGDTVGTGVPSDVVRLIKYLENGGISKPLLAGHFHDTYGQALANVWAAYQSGLRVFDTSIAGLGGCPYAPGAKGNLATEDLVYMFQQAGVQTGINLEELVNTGVWISDQLKKENSSRAGKALASKKQSSTSTIANARESSNSRVTLEWKPHKSYDGLTILRNGVNIKIILNRPKNGNALTTSMISNLTAFFQTAASDQTITRIVITARGPYFCTGMDLAKGSSPVAQGSQETQAQYERLKKLFDCIDKAPQVTIAGVAGPTFGGGVGLTFACDIRLMSEGAAFTLSEVKLGLSPATISKYVIREWGPSFAREAMLSARRVSATELARLGKVSMVVKDEAELDLALEAYLVRLKGAAPEASAMSKELIRLACDEEEGGRQGVGIKEAFAKMMSNKNKEVVFGLKQFQSGNKKVDWDAFALEGETAKCKL